MFKLFAYFCRVDTINECRINIHQSQISANDYDLRNSIVTYSPEHNKIINKSKEPRFDPTKLHKR